MGILSRNRVSHAEGVQSVRRAHKKRDSKRKRWGLPEDLLAQKADVCCTIPMKPNQRSLNLSNSVAIVVYEAIRQCGL